MYIHNVGPARRDGNFNVRVSSRAVPAVLFIVGAGSMCFGVCWGVLAVGSLAELGRDVPVSTSKCVRHMKLPNHPPQAAKMVWIALSGAG